jgi:hypothetical protein
MLSFDSVAPTVTAFFIVAIALIAQTAPMFAQAGSCENFCGKRCQTAYHQNVCVSKCIPACNRRKGKH